MIPANAIEQTLAELASATETLLDQLRRRDPSYLESLHRRNDLLERLHSLCQKSDASPLARAALERIRQLGEACYAEACRFRSEIAAALAGLERHTAYAESLRRLTTPSAPSFLDVKA